MGPCSGGRGRAHPRLLGWVQVSAACSIALSCLILPMLVNARTEAHSTAPAAFGRARWPVAASRSLSPDLVRVMSGEDGTWSDGFGPPSLEDLDGAVECGCIYRGDLIVGGQFVNAGRLAVNHIARWDGVSWHALGSGCDKNVLALAVYRDSVLFVGGNFRRAGDTPAYDIAQWDGGSWAPMGINYAFVSSLPDPVRALLVYQGKLVVAGAFVRIGNALASGIATWNGAGWTHLGSGVSGGSSTSVNSLTIHHGNLIAAGDFTIAGGVPASSIAEWNGTTWTNLGPGLDGPVNALTVLPARTTTAPDTLYAAGDFTSSGGTPVGHVSLWTGTTWQPTNFPTGGTVRTLLSSPEGLIAGGSFTFVDPVHLGQKAANVSVRSLDGRWTNLGGGLDDTVSVLANYNDVIVAGGRFTSSPDRPCRYAAVFDGDSWNPVGADLSEGLGFNGDIRALAVFHDRIVAGGEFDKAGSIYASNIAWSTGPGGAWIGMGGGDQPGVNGPVTAIVPFGNDLIAAGGFTFAGGRPVGHIARWDGSAWYQMGSGLSGAEGSTEGSVDVGAMAVYQGSLIVGGIFGFAGESKANHLARWDGTSWSPLNTVGLRALGSGDDSIMVVRSFAVYHDTLIVAGSIHEDDGSVSPQVVAWDGTSWRGMTTGLFADSSASGASFGTINAMAVHGDTLIAGGAFGVGNPANAGRNLGRWDEGLRRWVPISSLVRCNAPVTALLEYAGDLIAAGSFTQDSTQAGVTLWPHVARLRGGRWIPVGDGTDGAVHSLAVQGTDLYLGGIFTKAGGAPSFHIGSWKGTELAYCPFPPAAVGDTLR